MNKDKMSRAKTRAIRSSILGIVFLFIGTISIFVAWFFIYMIATKAMEEIIGLVVFVALSTNAIMPFFEGIEELSKAMKHYRG